MNVKLIFSFSLIFFVAVLYADSSQRSGVLLNDNQILTQMWNYGSFSSPGNRTTDFVWNGLGYAYEIGFFVGAEVEVPQGSHPDVFQETGSGRWMAHIISDGLKSSGGEVSPDGKTRWGWQPIASKNNGTFDYFDLSSPEINGNNDPDLDGDGIPDGWPQSWWNAETEEYTWPGFWGREQQPVYSERLYGMDDRDNLEFEYYPFTNDSSRRGLGVQMEVRSFQINNFYENVVFVTMDMTNVSDRDLDKMLFGVWSDPHIGGADDWRDDWQSFDPQRQMLYAWDGDGSSINNPDIVPGYFGISFVQTPGNAGDGIDNDMDGLVDESQNDGIDNDGDWNAATDDVGADGIAGTSDTGEGDGIPTLGEPAFEYKDMDEADMPGIASFRTPLFSEIRMNDDEKIWQYLTPGKIDTLETAGDYVLLGGSGYFDLKKGETKRVGLIFAFGQDLEDLQQNSDDAAAYYRDNLGSQLTSHPINVSEPQANSAFENSVSIQWDASSLPTDATLYISYRSGVDGSWTGIGVVPNTGSYTWNTENIAGSAFYKIRLQSVSPVTNALGESEGYFSIAHTQSGNTPPEIFFDFPEGRSVKEDFTVSWLKGDADGDALQLHLIVSSETRQDTISVTGSSYVLNTKKIANGNCTLILLANDGTASAKTQTSIQINNTFPPLPESSIVHKTGAASGALFADITDEEQLIRNTYFISFDDTSTAQIQYSVFDSLNQTYLITGDALPEYPQAGRLFDGMRLSFQNNSFAFDADESGWSEASATNLDFDIERENSYAADPFDYEIRFFNGIVDTTVNNIKVNFLIRDLVNDSPMESAVSGSHPEWQPGDVIYILRGGTSTANIVWEIDSSFPDGETQKSPGDGDVYYLKTKKPFSAADTYSLNTSAVGIKEGKEILPERLYLEQNYPNPFNNSTTIRFSLAQAMQVQLQIFDVRGQKVKTLFRGQAAAGMNRFIWNGKNKNGKDAASGLYFYRLKTRQGSVVKKLILVK